MQTWAAEGLEAADCRLEKKNEVNNEQVKFSHY